MFFNLESCFASRSSLNFGFESMFSALTEKFGASSSGAKISKPKIIKFSASVPKSMRWLMIVKISNKSSRKIVSFKVEQHWVQKSQKFSLIFSIDPDIFKKGL